MLWDFHGLCVQGLTNDSSIYERWQASFASRPATLRDPDLSYSLSLVPTVAASPKGQPDYSQAELLHYYVSGDRVIAHFPRFGQIRLDLAQGRSGGELLESALTTPGAFEDLLAIGLSPHFRRRGLYLIHAFAAAREKRGVLIVGDIGAGKTTTGMALLHGGWKLLSNDSPIITGEMNSAAGTQTRLEAGSGTVTPQPIRLLSYPGLMSAYPDSLARFPELAGLAVNGADRSRKVTFSAESVWPGVWQDQAVISAILFPRVEQRRDHTLEQINRPEALRLLLPHAVEQWDREMIPAHLALLTRLAESTPAFSLRLAPDISAIPALIASVLPS